MGVHRTHYVCLPCRASYKQEYGPERARRCPRCAAGLIHAGSAFAAPRRNDGPAWRALTVLLTAGVGFHKSCCGGPGFRPRTPRAVRERLAHAAATGEPVVRALTRYDLSFADRRPGKPGSRSLERR